MSQATSGEEKYSHIDEKDKQAVVEKVAVVQKWLEDLVFKQGEMDKWRDPVLKSEDIGKKRDEVIYYATPILNKPKPKVRSSLITDDVVFFYTDESESVGAYWDWNPNSWKWYADSEGGSTEGRKSQGWRGTGTFRDGCGLGSVQMVDSTYM